MRYEHLIGAAKGQTFPTEVVALDCGSRWEPDAKLAHGEREVFTSFVGAGMSGKGGVYGREVWCQGLDVSELWPCLERRLRRGGIIWCVSERASRVWCMLGLWSDIESGWLELPGRDHRDAMCRSGKRKGARPGACTLEDPPFVLDVRPRGCNGTLKILDLANFGVTESPEGTIPSMRVQRCLSFFRGMCSSVKRWNLGSVKATVASQALTALKTSYLQHYWLAHGHEPALALEGESYYGGRCEALQLGTLAAPVHHLDFASAYPYLYGRSLLPLSLLRMRECEGASRIDSCADGEGRIARVTVRTDEPDYPYRDERRKLVVWPVGTFATTLAGPELDDACRLGRVVAWHKVAEYAMSPGLAAYSRMALEMRDELASNADLKSWAKMVGNCLVGKMGQRDRRWVDVPRNDLYPTWGQWDECTLTSQREAWRSVAGYSQREEVGDWSFDAMPAVAAWITSLGRMALLSAIRAAGWPEVYYVDTDSLMVSEYGAARLAERGWVQPREPGSLSYKCVSERTVVYGIKTYDERGVEVRAGRSKNPSRLRGNVGRFGVNRGVSGACREGIAPDTLRLSVPWIGAGIYRHGKRTASGRVEPIRLGDG